MKRKTIASITIIYIIVAALSFFAGCSPASVSPEDTVTIVDKGTHFEVIIDYSSGKTHREIGEELGDKILQAVPNYEALVDSYLLDVIGNWYGRCIDRAKKIKPQINQDYIDEIEGIASRFSGADENKPGDGKISVDECYVLNLIGDVARGTQCSALGVYGDRSKTGETMSARILDWPGGSENQIAQIQSVTTYKNGDKSVCSISYLGFVGIITGFNDNNVFAAILDSSSGGTYSAESKRSYPLDIRYALENYETIEGVGEYLASSERKYAFSHLVFLCDEDVAIVLENNMGSISNSGIRDFRYCDSVLNDGIEWGISDSLCCVNSFLLDGNYDNHKFSLHNTKRWENMKRELTSKGDKVSLSELKEVATYYSGSANARENDGDIYNQLTQQIVIFEPGKMKLEVFFRPKNDVLPDEPDFEKIKVDFD